MTVHKSSAPTGEDLLDSSRYGELEDVTAILSSGVDSDHQDEHGNTALHLSSANGHADVIGALIKAGARHLPNGAGNRPLQWAVQNKHEACVKALLELFPEPSQMNVLDKNGFGKSALTDAFMSGDAELVKMILNHKSAEEDMLLSQSSLGKDKKDNQTAASKEENPTEGNPDDNAQTAGPADVNALGADSADTKGGRKDDNDGQAKGGDGVSITHELGFGVNNSAKPNSTGKGVSFVVRELAIRNPDDCFGNDPTEDTTGLCLWGASVVLARWVASAELQKRLVGKSVLELGAGCGAGGISAAVHGRPTSMVMTDLNVETMANLAHNIELNRELYPEGTEVHAATLDWEDESTWTAAAAPCDIVLGCDLVYQAKVTPKLLHTVLSLLEPGGIFFHVCPVGERDGLEEFLAHVGVVKDGKAQGSEGVGTEGRQGGGFELVSVTNAPAEYAQNPLVSGSEEEYILHFNELPTTTYLLMECRKRA